MKKRIKFPQLQSRCRKEVALQCLEERAKLLRGEKFKKSITAPRWLSSREKQGVVSQ